MGACSLSLTNLGLVPTVPGGRFTGYPIQIGVGLLTMPASYDTSGSTLDLSSYFDTVDKVFITPTAGGPTLRYAAGSTAANGKIMAYQAEGAHVHGLFVTGGGAEANQVPIVVASDDLRLEKAKSRAFGGSLAGPASYAAGGFTLDLSSYFADNTVVVTAAPKSIRDEYLIYVPGTTAANGKLAAIVASTGIEVANGTNLSAVNYQWVAYGIVTNTTDLTITGGAAGVTSTGATGADEIANATDLSSFTAGITILGQRKSPPGA